MTKLARLLFSLSLTLLLFIFLSGIVRFWSNNGTLWLTSGTYLLGVTGGLILLSILLLRGRVKELRLEPEVFAAGLLLVFFNDWLCRNYSMLQGPAIRGEIILGALITLVLLRRRMLNVFALFTPLAIVLLTTSFLTESSGRILFNDDHASFYYRLMLLKENFPDIPFYNPLWNGGVESREFFPSGVLNVFFLTAPLIYLFDVEKIYNLIIVLIMFGITPAATYLACRMEKLSRPIPALAALLAMTSSLVWYEWALVYGTIGFVTSIALMPIIVIAASKILAKDDALSLKETILTIVVGTLMLFWSLSGVVFLPLIIIGIFLIRRVLKKRYMLGMFITLFLLNAPWIVIFVQASNVFSFMKAEKEESKKESVEAPQTGIVVTPEHVKSADTISSVTENKVQPKPTRRKYKHRAGKMDFIKAKKFIREKAGNSNPLLIFMALPGIFLLRRRTRITYIITGLWLLFLGGAVVTVKPQLELDRMLIVLVFISSIPAAVAIYEVMRRALEKPAFFNTTMAALLGGFLFASPLSVAAILNNRTLEQFRFKSPTYEGLAEAIKTKTPADGRVIFSGFIMHELSNGHVAPLALEAERPLIASSYQHDKWWYTDVIPVEYLKKGHSGMKEYFDLYNVKGVIAHEPKLKKLFLSNPSDYELIWKGGHNDRFMLFLRKNYHGDYFLEGTGEILSQETNCVVLKLHTPDAVLKFTYLPFVQVAGCEVSERRISEHVSFIELKGCPVDQPLKIYAKSAFERFFLSHFRGRK